jgi:hypothetical protein
MMDRMKPPQQRHSMEGAMSRILEEIRNQQSQRQFYEEWQGLNKMV